MNHLPEHFKLKLATNDDFVIAHKWVSDEEENVTPVLHCRFNLDSDSPIDTYAKLMPLGTREGQIECINEISGWLLGQASGLPLANTAFLASVAADKLPPSQRLAVLTNPDEELFFFCTEAISKSQARAVMHADELAKEQSNWIHCNGTISFDEWTGNTDRHVNNLIRRAKNDFVLIDHGRLLSRRLEGPCWHTAELKDLRATPLSNLLFRHAYTCQSVTLPPALHAGYTKCAHQAAHQKQAMRVALHEISYWCSLVAPGVSAEWLHFLHHRTLNADALLQNRFGQLPF
jgi:hypothetical protein